MSTKHRMPFTDEQIAEAAERGLRQIRETKYYVELREEDVQMLEVGGYVDCEAVIQQIIEQAEEQGFTRAGTA